MVEINASFRRFDIHLKLQDAMRASARKSLKDRPDRFIADYRFTPQGGLRLPGFLRLGRVQNSNARIAAEIVDVESLDVRNAVHRHCSYDVGVMRLFTGNAVRNNETAPFSVTLSESGSRKTELSTRATMRSDWAGLRPSPLLSVGRVHTVESSMRF